jgi:antirestriction protein ArdC
MSLMTLFQPNLRNDLNALVRKNINNRIIKALEDREVPWQKPWEGSGPGVGFPRDVRTKKKFFGINFLLLQMAAKEHHFTSSWWGTTDEFTALGSNVKSRPDQVQPGCWATETVLYKNQDNRILTMSSIVYNSEQLMFLLESCQPNSKLYPSYDLAERVLHGTKAKISYNDTGEAYYFYPPYDFITFPERRAFEEGLGGLPGYYESLAHELVHWSEPRLGFDVDCDEGIRELRADIGAAMLMEELGVPHSISFSNFEKWRTRWLALLREDFNLIFKVAASATKAVDYIMGFTVKVEPRFNAIEESAA